MIYISAQPGIQYFAWQIDVMLHSFQEQGVQQAHVLCAKPIDGYFQKLEQKHSFASFFYYDDVRQDKSYIPSIKLHLLATHLRANPALENETLFLTDSDIYLTKPINFSSLLEDDIWYVSDTVSYLGYDYIASKGSEVLDLMLQIGNIPKELVQQNQSNAGGAQYLFKKTNASYFEEAEKMAVQLFKKVTEYINKHPERKHPIQIWTAEMWALLWVAWKNGKQTKVNKILDFCFATDPVKRWDEVAIYHNAGVTVDMTDLFFKGAFIYQMPSKNLTVNPEKTSFNYYEKIKEVLHD